MKRFVLILTLTSVFSLSAQWGKGIQKIADQQAGTSFIFKDTAGTVWIGLGGYTGNAYNRYSQGLKKYRNGQLSTVYPAGTFTAALQSGNEVFFTANNGFYTYRNDSMLYDASFPYGMCLASYNGKTWAGTLGKGLYEISKGVKQQLHVDVGSDRLDSIYSLCADGNILWIGTTRGLVKYDGSSFTKVQTPFVKIDNGSFQDKRQRNIMAIQTDAMDRLWILTAGRSDTVPCLYFMDQGVFRNAGAYYTEQCVEWGNIPNFGFHLGRTAQGHVLLPTWWGVIEMSDKLENHSFDYSVIYGFYDMKTLNSRIHVPWAQASESSDGKWYISNYLGILEIDLAAYNSEPFSHNPYTNYLGASNTIDINDIGASFSNDGTMFNASDISLQLKQMPSFKAKSLGCNDALFTGALWLGGSNRANGDLHVAAQTYRQRGFDFVPGPVNINTKQMDTVLSRQYQRIWKVNRKAIDEFLANRSKPGYRIPQEILDWPGNAPSNCIREMAPYEDVDQDGVYDPSKGDYPKIKGDQMLWWVFNDLYEPHYESQGKPLKVQVNGSCYAYMDIRLTPKDPDYVVNRTIFFEYKVFNLSDNIYDDFAMGIFNDVDLGNFSDDYVGCDSAENVAFAFNADNNDEGKTGFGKNPPMIACKFLNQKMSNVKYYNNDMLPNGNPALARDFYAYMFSSYYQNDSLVKDVTYYEPYYPCHVRQSQIAGDKRLVSSCHKDSLAPGGSFKLEFAYILLHDPNIDFLKDGCDNPRDNFKKIQQWYDNNSFPSKPYWPAGIDVISTGDMLVYPNPASTALYIDAGKEVLEGDIQIFDAAGKLVMQTSAKGQQNIQLDISSFSEGLYIIKVNDGRQVFSSRFIKQ